VLAVEGERSSLGAFATAQGRVAALVRVLALEDSLLLVLPRSEAQALHDRLARHVLRAKVELTDESDAWSAIGLLDAGGVAALAAGAARFLRKRVRSPVSASSSSSRSIRRHVSSCSRRARPSRR
jgi:folate-binding Fe-S cluster repair protein YgfZ